MTATRLPGKQLCPNGCGQRIYSGHLERHLRACRRTKEETAAERAWRRFVRGIGP